MPDIYNIQIDQLVGLERMAQKSAENLVIAINESKKQPFNKVLFSLGIRYVGETVSKKFGLGGQQIKIKKRDAKMEIVWFQN